MTDLPKRPFNWTVQCQVGLNPVMHPFIFETEEAALTAYTAISAAMEEHKEFGNDGSKVVRVSDDAGNIATLRTKEILAARVVDSSKQEQLQDYDAAFMGWREGRADRARKAAAAVEETPNG